MNVMKKVLRGEHVIFPLGWDDLGTRKTAFADVFMSLLEKMGYTNPSSLRIRGAYAFNVNEPGVWDETTRIGLKTAYNGWLNTAHVMVENVDLVWVMSFRWDGENPAALDVHEIKAQDLLELYDRLHTTRAKLKRSKDHTYIPVLDSTREVFLADHPGHYACSEGALEDHAKLIYTAPLVWSNIERPGIKTPTASQKETPVASEPLQGIAGLVFEHKEALAKLYGTTVDKVRILVEA